jgi:hypothetical protein
MTTRDLAVVGAGPAAAIGALQIESPGSSTTRCRCRGPVGVDQQALTRLDLEQDPQAAE